MLNMKSDIMSLQDGVYLVKQCQDIDLVDGFKPYDEYNPNQTSKSALVKCLLK